MKQINNLVAQTIKFADIEVKLEREHSMNNKH